MKHPLPVILLGALLAWGVWETAKRTPAAPVRTSEAVPAASSTQETVLPQHSASNPDDGENTNNEGDGTLPFAESGGQEVPALRTVPLLSQIDNQELRRILSDMATSQQPEIQQAAARLAEQYVNHPRTSFIWAETDCPPAFNADTNARLSCRESSSGICAFFENKRPFLCRTPDGQTEYRLNQWGSSVTVRHKTQSGEPVFEHYYADGKLARAAEYDAPGNRVTTVWFSGDSLRMTQTNSAGRVLHKYYFDPGKPYIHYPDGNDMGETNGPWEEKDGYVWTDGQPLFPLPQKDAAPDVCRIFSGACVQTPAS